MTEKSSLSRIHTLIRRALLVFFLLAVIFSIGSYVLLKKDAKNPPVAESIIVQDPVAPQFDQTIVDFVNNYFKQIEEEEYQVLLQQYWLPEVVQEIRQECANPLDDDPAIPTQQLWQSCATLGPIRPELIDVQEDEDVITVVLQFFDSNDEIIGLDIHPEWVRGHNFIIQKTESGLRTSDWKFLDQ